MFKKTLWFFVLLPFFLQAQPTVQWRKTIKNDLQSINSATAVSEDKSGNIIVLGTTHLPDSARKLFIVKFDSDGEELWHRVYENKNRDAISVALAIDGDNNIVLTGTVRNESGNTDIITMKYNPDGVRLWESTYAGRSNLFDAPTAIAVDRLNNVLVCGYETITAGNPDLLLLRYQSNGNFSFLKSYSTRELDIAVDVGTDDSCNVYVCGSVDAGIRSGDLAVLKYDSTGNSMWKYRYDGSEHAVDQATDMFIDDSSMVFITGSVNRANDKADVPLLKLSRNGMLLCESLVSAGVSDGIGGQLAVSGKRILLQTVFTDYLQQTVTPAIQTSDRYCTWKSRLFPASGDVTYLKALPWENGSTLLFGSILSRPENTIAPYFEVVDSLYKTSVVFQDNVLVSLLRVKDVFLSGRNVIFLGDDATDNSGAISVAKYAFPEEPKKKSKATNRHSK